MIASLFDPEAFPFWLGLAIGAPVGALAAALGIGMSMAGAEDDRVRAAVFPTPPHVVLAAAVARWRDCRLALDEVQRRNRLAPVGDLRDALPQMRALRTAELALIATLAVLDIADTPDREGRATALVAGPRSVAASAADKPTSG